MKTILSVALLALTSMSYAQDSNNVFVGKWEYLELYNAESLDSAGAIMMQKFFGETVLQFADGTECEILMMGKEDKGSYKVIDGANGIVIELTSSRGEVMPVEIIELKGDTMAIALSRAQLVMVKTSDEMISMVSEPEVVEEIVPVSATVEQVAHKWNLIEKETSTDNELAAAMTLELIQGSYINLKKNGKYEVEMLGIKEKGTWEFGENNTSIVTIGEGKKQIWTIISITESKMILIAGIKGKKWTFSLD